MVYRDEYVYCVKLCMVRQIVLTSVFDVHACTLCGVVRVCKKPLIGTMQIPRANKHLEYVVAKLSTCVMSLLSVWWFVLVVPK
jgi:hypothetical protein